MPNRDTAYYLKRAAAERILSGLTTDARVIAIHMAMAERYDELAIAGELEGRIALVEARLNYVTS